MIREGCNKVIRPARPPRRRGVWMRQRVVEMGLGKGSTSVTIWPQARDQPSRAILPRDMCTLISDRVAALTDTQHTRCIEAVETDAPAD